MTNKQSGAANDPRQPRRPRLSQEFGQLAARLRTTPEPFDVVIVGSGYGGSVAARALAGRVSVDASGKSRPISVCVLERGLEYLPGEFPDRLELMPGHLRQADQRTGKIRGNAQGLFDIRMGPDVVALVANGVGGGSLINAGVLLEPRLADFAPGTPAYRLVDDLQQGNWYEKARTALGGKVRDADGTFVENTIERHPKASLVKKTAALETLGESGFKAPMITVSMDGQPNDADVVLTECNLCGDCMTGCNVGAKNSLDANLLDAAQRAGAEIYNGASVLWLTHEDPKDPDRCWILNVAHTDTSVQKRELEPVQVRARQVILAAGTLGSTEILLRSRSAYNQFSPVLGRGFSCNGDNLAAVHRMAEDTSSCADEDTPPGCRAVGPTITGSVTMSSMERSFQIQEFSVPGPMKRLFEELVTTAKVLGDLPRCDRSTHGTEATDALDPMAVDDDAIGRSLLVGIIGHDEADGVIHLPQPLVPRGDVPQQGTVAIRWPQARDGKRLLASHERLQRAVNRLKHRQTWLERLTGDVASEPSLIANPMWRLLPPQLEDLISQPRGPVLTVHPLGGCRIGSKVSTKPDAGVVDTLGRVYDLSQPEEEDGLDTLVVLDGSIIPGSLGVNPSLTITAAAMRAMDEHCKNWKYVEASAPVDASRVIWLRRTAPKADVPPPAQDYPTRRGATEIQIVERLSGPVTLASRKQGTRPCIVELTLSYEPMPLGDLMSRLHRQVVVRPEDRHSRLRIFDAGEWDRMKLKLEEDDVRDHYAIFEGRLSGTLTVFRREASTPWQRILRAGYAWLLNRGTRDTWQRLTQKQPVVPGKQPGFLMALLNYGLALIKMSSRAGEVRRFDYDLQIAEILHTRRGKTGVEAGDLTISGCDAIRGSKRLTFGRRANPWRQLTELALTTMPGMPDGVSAVLKLDGRFLAGEGVPLLRFSRQRNSVLALADFVSFGLYVARLIATIHLWTFRKPDTQPEREPKRLPGPIEGLEEPEVTELVVDHMPHSLTPVTIRLTRYNMRADGTPLTKRPLVMIHGYSASGNTFTHPTLTPSAAAYFTKRGYDVWVVDLRTSAALDTCTYPWAMEQAGLVDIPAALMHIRNRTNQQVDVLAHCIGCVMLSMAILTDSKEILDNQIQLGSDSWLTKNQLGILKAFNGEAGKDSPHPCIRRVILSQKGPVLRYTDNNIFRAFILQSLRRWLMRDDYQFRPSRDPGVAEQLIDRLLASIPYGNDDYDIENPLWPCALTPWTATRHRMDALYGRAFNATNMSKPTLDAIDDIFGPINMETVSQTIHFARVDAITNQAGRGEFVTRDRLEDRWGRIQTLAIHGVDNGLVDILTQTLLKEHMGGAGVPLSEPSKAANYERLGHQDVLMGTSARPVFDDMLEFLEQPDETASKLEMPNVITVPWSGPRFDLPAITNATVAPVAIACLSDPTQGCGTMVLVPTLRWRLHDGDYRYWLVDAPEAVVNTEEGSSAAWFFATPDMTSMSRLKSALAEDKQSDATLGWLALIIYRPGETTARISPLDKPNPAVTVLPEPPETERGPSAGDVPPHDIHRNVKPIVPLIPHPEFPLQNFMSLKLVDNIRFDSPLRLNLGIDRFPPDVLPDVKQWLVRQRPQDLDLAFVDVAAYEAAQRLLEPAPAALNFAFASCQYASGLVDTLVSQSTLTQLATAIDAPETSVDLALFIGDQIYADATAGLIDPTRRDELYDAPNDKALRAAGMRSVLRRVPAMMLLDDHELRDNWEPVPGAVAEVRHVDNRDNQRVLRHGFHAWSKFQRMRPVPGKAVQAGAGDLAFAAGGHPFFLLDTRTGRSARGSTIQAGRQRILTGTQCDDLQKWLVDHKDEVKFVATPSILLPRRRTSEADPTGDVHSDAWDGFPHSMDWLFALLIDEKIINTVFLSGDEHHSMIAEAVVSSKHAGKGSVRIVSVHSSGSYAPYPFANGHPDEMATETVFELASVRVEARTRFAPAGDGFARVGVDATARAISVQWFKADGPACQPETILL